MLRWVLRVPRPVTLRDHLWWAGIRVGILWNAYLFAALAVAYLPLGLTRIV